MYKRILRKMREKIRSRQYVMTLHAEEEMSNDGLTIIDIENIILNGEIVERQKDHYSGEWKYLISGLAVDRRVTIVVTKLSFTDKLVIITVYLEE